MHPPALLVKYCRQLTQCPIIYVVLYNVLALAVIGLLFRELKVDMEFESFGKADGEAMRKQDAYEAVNKVRETPLDRPFYTPPNFTTGKWPRKLQFIYVAKQGSILDDGPLGDIRVFEGRLKQLPEWVEFCEREVLPEDYYYCKGESFINVRFPTQLVAEEDHQTHIYQFDGEGNDPLSELVAFAYMQQNEGQVSAADTVSRFFPSYYEVPSLMSQTDTEWKPYHVQTMRSIFTMMMWVNATSAQFFSARQAASDRYTEFARAELYEFLEKEIESSAYPNIDIYFGGDDVLNYQALQVAMSDTLFVIVSSAFVTFYMWLHTRSLLVSTMSLWVILLAIPMGYVLVPTEKISVASGFSLFLMMGVGCDVVFVFNDFWKQSEEVGELPERLAWTLGHAARSCLATSLTTSVSFFANVASALRPLREFGLFMGMCVMSAYVLLMLVLPPVTVIVSRGVCPRPPVVDATDPFARRFRRQESMKKAEHTKMGRLARAVAMWPRAIAVSSVLMVVIMCVSIAFSVSVDTDVPDIFPAGHNQREFPDRKGAFGAWDARREVPDYTAAVCSVSDWETSGCLFHWCDAQLESVGDGNSSGTCWRSPTLVAGVEQSDSTIDFCGLVTFKTRVATVGLQELDAWVGAWSEVLEAQNHVFEVNSGDADMGLLNSSLVLENWERGDQQLREFYDLGSMTGIGAIANAVECEVKTICFFGSRPCDIPGWEWFADVNLSSRRLTQVDRNLSIVEEDTNTTTTTTIPSGKQLTVTVVWGVRPPQSSPLINLPDPMFSYDSTFQLSNPWAQRAIYQMCTEVPDSLRVIRSDCWIVSFRNWLLEQGLVFPSRDIHYEARWWFSNAGSADQASTYWQRSTDEIVGCKVSFRGVARGSSPAKVLEYMDDWEAHIKYMNSRASLSANHAYQTSKDYVEAEADLVIISSTVETVLIAAACAFLAMIAFTCDPVIALYVLGLVLGIIIGLLFFILVVFQWPIGPIEVISLIIFVGYSVTYSLHIAHNFAELTYKDDDLMTCSIIQEHLALSQVCPPEEDVPPPPLALAPPQEPEAEEVVPPIITAGEPSYEAQPSPAGARSESIPAQSEMLTDRSHWREGVHEQEIAGAVRIWRQSTGAQKSEDSTAKHDAKERQAAFEVIFESLPTDVLRRARALLAVQRIGLATLSSAISTVGSSIVLFLCTILVFKKLAAVLTTVTVLSILVALITLPAILMVAGPPALPWYKRVPREFIANAMAQKKVGAQNPHAAGLLTPDDDVPS